MEGSPIARGRGRPRKIINKTIESDLDFNGLNIGMIDFQTSNFCGIELDVLPLFGIKLMIFLKEFSSQTR